MYNSLMLTCVFCLFMIPIVDASGQDEKSPSLKELHRQIDVVVLKHYPKATSYVFEDAIGFEFATRKYVTRLVAKRLPGTKPLIGLERGPMDGGVWCDIWYRSGDLKTEPAYARAAGVTRREFYREFILYPNDGQRKCHLIVVLRLPLETSESEVEFVEELKALLNQFGNHVSTSDK